MDNCVYTVPDVAGILQVSQKTVYRLVKDGRIKCIHIYGSIRIPKRALDDYLHNTIAKE